MTSRTFADHLHDADLASVDDEVPQLRAAGEAQRAAVSARRVAVDVERTEALTAQLPQKRFMANNKQTKNTDDVIRTWAWDCWSTLQACTMPQKLLYMAFLLS